MAPFAFVAHYLVYFPMELPLPIVGAVYRPKEVHRRKRVRRKTVLKIYKFKGVTYVRYKWGIRCSVRGLRIKKCTLQTFWMKNVLDLSKICTAPGCHRKRIGKGLCWAHYQRQRSARGLCLDAQLGELTRTHRLEKFTAPAANENPEA